LSSYQLSAIDGRMQSMEYFMWGSPCILHYMNNNQLTALLMFSLLSYHTSICFGRISSPSSGGRTHICGKWYLLHFWVGCHSARPNDSQLRSIRSTICHIYAFYLLMMGCWYARNM
jgi:hypothetical protein